MKKISNILSYMLNSGVDSVYCILLSDENINKLLSILQHSPKFPATNIPEDLYATYYSSIKWINLFNITNPKLIESIKLSYKFLYLDQYIFADVQSELDLSIFKAQYIKHIQEVFYILIKGDTALAEIFGSFFLIFEKEPIHAISFLNEFNSYLSNLDVDIKQPIGDC